MASPQKENGWTQIAHEILEALARSRLSGRELRIILLILRESFGYQRKEAVLSLRDIQLRTGIAKAHVSQALSSMRVTNVVRVTRVTENGNRSKSILSFQKDYHQWGVTKKVTVTKNGNGSVAKTVTVARTRAVVKKEKKTSSPAVRELIESFHQKLIGFHGGPLTSPFNGGALGRLYKRALEQGVSAEECECRNQSWFESDDEFIRRNGYSPTLFTQKFDLLKNGPLNNRRSVAPTGLSPDPYPHLRLQKSEPVA